MLSYQFALIKGLRLLEVTVLIVGYLGTLLARETINSGSPDCPTGETKVDQNSSSKEDYPLKVGTEYNSITYCQTRILTLENIV